MFKCSDKCTGIRAAEARLVRENICYDNALKEKDYRTMKNVSVKIQNTKDYIKFMEEWTPAANLAIKPAVRVYRLKPFDKRVFVMTQIQRVQETGINPINGRSLGRYGVTGVIIEYLISRYDRRWFAQYKRFLLTKERVDIIKSLISTCDDPKTIKFLKFLMG